MLYLSRRHTSVLNILYVIFYDTGPTGSMTYLVKIFLYNKPPKPNYYNNTINIVCVCYVLRVPPEENKS